MSEKNQDITSAARIRFAVPKEAPELSRLAALSKAYWGYSDEFMDACRGELTIGPDAIAAVDVQYLVVEANGDVAGFYALKQLSRAAYELEALYVDPDHIGKGYGGLLLDHALASVRDAGGSRLQIQSDPNATGFYATAGARQVGQRESGSIPGRLLPLLEINVLTG